MIRPRFSASRFWDDVVEWDCTLFQYIGELCRYLVNAPAHPREAEHRLRLCCGNGLRSDVWLEFKRRFRIPQILEFYASTEGNVSLYNCEGTPGAIGKIPSFLAHRSNLALVKFDVEAGEPMRNQEGFCVRCKSNEIGEAIGKIPENGSNLTSRFEGYADHEASERKVLRNVFTAGDAWFRTGDLMRKDDKGYFYFVDRVGDTFRWKGENVSTTEVATKISAYPGRPGSDRLRSVYSRYGRPRRDGRGRGRQGLRPWRIPSASRRRACLTMRVRCFSEFVTRSKPREHSNQRRRSSCGWLRSGFRPEPRVLQRSGATSFCEARWRALQEPSGWRNTSVSEISSLG